MSLLRVRAVYCAVKGCALVLVSHPIVICPWLLRIISCLDRLWLSVVPGSSDAPANMSLIVRRENLFVVIRGILDQSFHVFRIGFDK